MVPPYLNFTAMHSAFYIDLALKTPHGPEPYARFFIGTDPDRAHELFNKLYGTTEVNERDILYLDFIEVRKGLPANLKMISCTLEQLAKNCRIITKMIFQLANLKAN